MDPQLEVKCCASLLHLPKCPENTGRRREAQLHSNSKLVVLKKRLRKETVIF
jgi:hypothetical protein